VSEYTFGDRFLELVLSLPRRAPQPKRRRSKLILRKALKSCVIPEPTKTPSEVTLTYTPHPALSSERRIAAIGLIAHARESRLEKRVARKRRARLIGRGDDIYTPSMLRRFLEWDGEGCAFPLCDDLNGGVGMKTLTNWHLCGSHRAELLTFFRKQRKGVE
jgi:hypothetical protein